MRNRIEKVNTKFESKEGTQTYFLNCVSHNKKLIKDGKKDV